MCLVKERIRELRPPPGSSSNHRTTGKHSMQRGNPLGTPQGTAGVALAQRQSSLYPSSIAALYRRRCLESLVRGRTPQEMASPTEMEVLCGPTHMMICLGGGCVPTTTNRESANDRVSLYL